MINFVWLECTDGTSKQGENGVHLPFFIIYKPFSIKITNYLPHGCLILIHNTYLKTHNRFKINVDI